MIIVMTDESLFLANDAQRVIAESAVATDEMLSSISKLRLTTRTRLKMTRRKTKR